MNISLSALISLGQDKNATDIHIKGNQVFFRILNNIVKTDLSFCLDSNFASLIYELRSSKQDYNLLDALNDKSLALSVDGHRIRASFYKSLGGDCVSIRLLPSQIPSLKSLKLPSVIEKILEKKSGLILVCGATSSGKSTTIAGMIDFINSTYQSHIITLEDPIEYKHENKLSVISQREISTHTIDFNEALQSCMRQNPNVIVIGEIIDSKTLQEALKISLSGHLVISSFHANSCSGAVSRIVSMCADDNNIHSKLSESIQAIITQKLIVQDNAMMPDCEILISTPSVRTLLKDNKINQLDSQISMGREYGMQNFKKSKEK